MRHLTLLEIACLYGLAVCIGALLLAASWRTVREMWRRCEGRHSAFAAIVALAVICALQAQKRASFQFDPLIADAGSYATNDVLHVAATNASAYASFDFSDTTLLVYRRDQDSTNASDWVECVPRRLFGDLPADWTILDATNYNYLVMLDFVPPSPVHTNGVFEMRGFSIEGAPGTRAAGFINSSQKVLEEP